MVRSASKFVILIAMVIIAIALIVLGIAAINALFTVESPNAMAIVNVPMGMI